MPGVGLFLLAHWRAAGALLIVLALAGYIETLRLERDHAHSQEAKAKADLAKFKADVAAAGEAQDKRAAAIAAHDELLKEEADNDHETALAKLRTDVERVRRERDRNRSSILPPTPSSAGGADQACFDRPLVERAYGDLVTALRGLADEGSAAVIDLNTAKAWASGR